MKYFQFARLASALLLVSAAVAARSGQPVPDLPQYFPTCPAPQPYAPWQPVGGAFVNARASVAWNGRDYAVLYTDGNDAALHFRRFFADGTPAAPDVTVNTGLVVSSFYPSLAWNGSGYGAAFTAFAGGKFQTFFIGLDSGGGKLNGPTIVSNPSYDTADPVIAWSGSGYAVAWTFKFTATDYDIYGALLNPAGAITTPTFVVSGPIQLQQAPAITWSQGAGRYQVVWQDRRSSQDEIYGRQLAQTGGMTTELNLVTSAGTNAIAPALADNGDGIGLTWSDSRDGNNEIYFARMAAGGAKLGTDLRLTIDAATSNASQIVWTGSEYGIFWHDYRGGNYDLWFQRVTAAGATPGGNVQLTATGGANFPAAAFGRFDYLLTGSGSAGVNFVLPVGCGTDTTPPTCPGNFLAYNITGTTATIAWLPSDDPESDIAYYQVYKDNAPLAKTSDTYYAATGLGLSSTSNFSLRPVNAGQLSNAACSTSIYVKTNSSLTLTMNKSTPDAVLNWTDAGFNSYNVFRGNDPRVMSQIGATPTLTAPDANALSNSLSYFYSVDNPGP